VFDRGSKCRYQAVLALHAEGSIEADKLTILAEYDLS